MFKKLILRNFLSVGNKPQTINFKDGINLLSGENGVGKSTIIKALKLILFNNVGDKKSKTELINWDNKKNMFVELQFTKNNLEYIVGRSLKCKDKDDFYLFKDDKKQNFSDEKSFSDDIHKLLNVNPKIASQTIFLDAEFYVPFLSLTKDKKRDFIRPIFDLMKYDEMKELIKKDIKILDNEISNSTQNKAILSEKKNTVIVSIENQKQSLYDDNSNREELLKTCLDELKTFETEKDNFTLLDSDEYEKKNIDLKEKLLKCEKTIIRKEANKEKVEESKKSIEKKNVDLKEKKKELSENENIIYQKPLTQLIIDDINSKVEQSKLNLSNIKNESNLLFKANKFYEKNDECKECGQFINEIFKAEQLKNNNKIIDKNLKSCELIKKELERLNDHKQQYSKYEKELKEYERNVYENNIKIKQLNESIAQLETDIKTDKSKIVEIDEEYIEKLHKAKTKIEKRIEENNKIISKSNENNSKYNKIISDISLKNQETKSNEKRIEENNIKIKTLNDDTQVKEIEERIERLNIFIEEKNDKKNNLLNLLLCVGDNGIKKYIIGKSVPFLNQIAKKYCEAINSKFMIKFNRNGLDVDIVRRGKNVSFWSPSSGQRQRLNLVIMFVFIQFMKIKTNQTFPAIFFDEILNSSLDENGINDLLVILKELKNDISYIYLISHDNNTKALCDNEIKVEMNGRFTNYKQLEN